MKKRAARVCGVLTTGVIGVWMQAAVPLSRQAADVPRLVPGASVERELPRRDEHGYALTLDAGQFARVIVEQHGIDVAVRAHAPDGRVLAEFDRETGRDGVEDVDVVAPAAGTYAFTIKRAPGAPAAGTYAIRLAERRPATRSDQVLQESRTLAVTAAGLERDGQFGAARVQLERALAAAESACGDGDLQIGAVSEQLAGVYRKLPDAIRSEALYRRAIEIDEDLLGPQHPRTAHAQAGLAVLYQRQGNRARAEALLEQSLATIENTLGRNHPWYVSGLATLGDVRDASGDLAEEERIIRRGLATLEAIDESESAQYAALLNNLGEVYRQKGDYAVAEACLLRALSLDDTLLGSGNYASATPLQNLGIVARERRNYPVAIAYNMRALAIRERAVGSDHPDVAHILDQSRQRLSRDGRHGPRARHALPRVAHLGACGGSLSAGDAALGGQHRQDLRRGGRRRRMRSSTNDAPTRSSKNNWR